jgi:hypothetical protein
VGAPGFAAQLLRANTGAQRYLTTAVVSPDGLFVVGLVPNTPTTNLFVFDPRGVDGCTGAPATCAPLWSAATDVLVPAAVAHHVAYVPSVTGLRAYDARGATNCSGNPKVCTPLWTGTDVRTDTSPAVANGVVYVAGSTANCDFVCLYDRHLYAFDAGGTTNCAAAHVCSPLWQYDEAGSGTPYGEPVIANGFLYAANAFTQDARGPTVFTVPE